MNLHSRATANLASLSREPDKPFNLSKYFEYLENSIQNILSRREKNVLTFDILDTKKTKKTNYLH